MDFDKNDFFRVFSAKLSSHYPGTSIAIEFIVMRAWLENMAKGTEITCREYIDQELKKFPPDTDFSEFSHVYDIAEEDIPRIVNLAALVVIVALFENGFSRLLFYCSKKQNIPFKLIDRVSLVEKYQDFLSTKLKIGYELDNQFIHEAKDILAIRNLCAHGSGMIYTFSSEEKTTLDNNLQKKLFDIIERSNGQLSFVAGQLIISNLYLQNSFNLFEQQTKILHELIEGYYFKKV